MGLCQFESIRYRKIQITYGLTMDWITYGDFLFAYVSYNQIYLSYSLIACY
jgi:hypothetical protein